MKALVNAIPICYRDEAFVEFLGAFKEGGAVRNPDLLPTRGVSNCFSLICVKPSHRNSKRSMGLRETEQRR